MAGGLRGRVLLQLLQHAGRQVLAVHLGHLRQHTARLLRLVVGQLPADGLRQEPRQQCRGLDLVCVIV